MHSSAPGAAVRTVLRIFSKAKPLGYFKGFQVSFEGSCFFHHSPRPQLIIDLIEHGFARPHFQMPHPDVFLNIRQSPVDSENSCTNQHEELDLPRSI